jgi:hypothetical protein
MVTIDSADRDTSKFYTNGDFVVYLPRQYQNVVSIRLMSGEFPHTVKTAADGSAHLHSYADGPNTSTSNYTSDITVNQTNNSLYYFLIEIEGLNYADETTVGGNKSTFTDSFLAKIPTLVNSASFIDYSDNSGQSNITRFTPALGTLDRLHIRVRTHAQQGKKGFLYWTANNAFAAPGNRTVNFSLCLEIEMLDNGFDDFSSLETRISDRA